jgi:NAD(P)-dependent dehydrogenase (short-subunit alcohol dehydrogenase family)
MQKKHPLFPVKGKASLITGAARGIGLGTAKALDSAASDYITGQVMNVDGGWISA